MLKSADQGAEKLPKRDSARRTAGERGVEQSAEDSRNCQNAIVCESGGQGRRARRRRAKAAKMRPLDLSFFGISLSFASHYFYYCFGQAVSFVQSEHSATLQKIAY